MEITEVDELKTYEAMDKEPYHYMAAVRSSATGSWTFTYQYPSTDKQKLIENLIQYWGDKCSYTEARIYKMRLPIG